MDGEAEYLFQKIQRHLFLARSKERAEAEEHIDEASKIVTELERIWKKEQENGLCTQKS